MEKTYDVIIIGGGLLGCATAYQLAKRKAGRILLLDGNEIASQASSRAACLLTRARTKPALMELVQETYDCINEIETLLGESLELQQCGSITVASSEASLKGLEALEEAATRFGIPNERIPKDHPQRAHSERKSEGVASVDRCGSGGCGALYAHRCVYRFSAALFGLCQGGCPFGRDASPEL